jgi:HEPN domain-containing protein
MFAQQAGENAIKACLVCEQVEFPKTHDLNRLRELVPSDWAVAGVKQGLASLSEWAAESRYPGNWVEATREDAEESVRTAQAVLEAAESDFAVRGMTD